MHSEKQDTTARPDPLPASPITSARVLLEVCPPTVEDQERAYAVLRHSFACYNSFHAISVPDLQDAGEFHRQRNRVRAQDFAAWLREISPKPLGLYKVCVTVTEERFHTWLDRATQLGCNDIFLVGPDSSRKEIGSGTLDIEAAAALARARDFRCGGIIIPTRRTQFAARPASMDETERIIRKLRQVRLSFFTTQILYESEWTCCLLFDMVRMLSPHEIPKVFLTFSPFVCPEDISFAKSVLGVYLPADAERFLCGARSMREASISSLIGVWDRISSFARDIGFPPEKLGVNVEYMDSRNPRNVDAAFELAEEFSRLLRRR